MNENILISTAMVSTLWEKHHTDTLDMMLPFLKYSIGKTTRLNTAVDISAVSSHFKTEFGYDSIPDHVITIMFNRISPSILKRNKQKYVLSCSLDDDISSFENRRTLYKEHRTQVGEALSLYITENLSGSSMKYNCEAALSALIQFFVTKGICVVKEADMLSLLKNRDGKLDYCIAQFILQESKMSSAIFDYIIDMVKGFFVSTAISLQPDNYSVSQAKFKTLACYLDTRVIIDGLGLRLPEAKKATCELFSMLQKQNAKLFCFEHTLQEIADIINAYKKSINNPYQSLSSQTLEAWDEKNYSVSDVDRYALTLRRKIEKLGVTIVATPKCNVENYPFDAKGLVSYIEKNIFYSNKAAIDTDVDSVASVLILRNGSKQTEIERCGHIFVTTNTRLSHIVSQYLKKDIGNCIQPILTDTELASIVWLKSYSTHPDYPKMKLIENALASIDVTQTILNTFFEMVDRIRSEGGITADEAAVIRTDLFCRRELAKEIKGDETAITQDTVLSVRNKLKERYVEDIKGETSVNYQNYLNQKMENANSVRKAIEEINSLGEDKEKAVNRALSTVCWVILTVVGLIFLASLIYGIAYDNSFFIGTIVSLVISIIGFYDMIISRKKLIKSFINKQAKNRANKAMDAKKGEYERILGELDIDRFL